MADEDVRLGISAVDHGAARLVKGVADALRALASVQARQAIQTRAQATASREAANALRAEAQAARQALAAQRSPAQAGRARAQEVIAAARAAETAARQQERAAARAETALRRQVTQFGAVNRGAQTLRNSVLQLIAAYSGFRAIEGFVAAGLRFNQVIESSRLGIGALITAEADLIDKNGKLLTGTTALAAAQGLASDQLDKLRVAGIQTAATTEDLVTSFEEAVGAGLAVGLTLDQIRGFTVSIAQAASAIHLPMNQLQQETRSILQGTIDRNSRIAKALQLTNAEVNLAKQQGRLADLLNEKFKAFNIAGAESVKTFGALKSNIQDAFSVFAGRATQPLFTQIRDAAFKGLSQVFDFRTADIAASFRGLVSALQDLFQQIGGMLAEAITGAVERAQALSQWLAENREEVKRTAAAVRTMVEDFGHMVAAIVSGVTQMASLGGGTNTVIGLARTLSAIFQTIADNVKLIIALLAARTLITTIGGIATAIAAIRTVGIGAALGGAAGGAPGAAIGGTIGLILGLGTAYKLLKGFQRETTLETARSSTAFEDNRQAAAELLEKITSLQRQLQAKGLSTAETASLEAQLADAMARVTALGGDYGRVINENTGNLEAQRKKLTELLQTQQMQAAFAVFAAGDQLRALQAQKAAIPAPRKLSGVDMLNPMDVARHKEATEQIDAQLEVAQANVDALTAAYDKLAASIGRALEPPPTIKRHAAGTVDPNQDINDALQRAKAELEQVRAFNEAQRSIIAVDLKNGVITAIQQIERERDLTLAELSAQQKVAEAEFVVAQRRQIKGKAVPDQGAMDAARITIRGIEAQRVLARQESEERIKQIVQQRAQDTAEIEAQYQRVLGNRLQAIQIELENKHRQQLLEAIREFGEGSPQVIHLRLVIQQESIREQAEEIEKEIKRIEEARNQEIENARFRILGPENIAAGRTRGNAAQQQQIADAIAQANQHALESTASLRGALIDLRDQATDPIVASFIQKLIDELELLKRKSKEVDLTLKRLKEGVAEALISGLAGFFDAFTDKTRTLAGAFKDMVRSILSDMSRLVSRLLAEKIVFALLGLGGGGQAGNATQLQGRAEGGLARPRHGLLKGGIPGTDSIHIAAMPEEYFTQVKAVRHYGVEFMDMINNMELPRIDPRSYSSRARLLAAGGGPLQPSTDSARPSARQDVHHHISVDRHGLLDVLNGPPGERATLGHIRRNPRHVGSVVRQVRSGRR